MSKKVVLVGHCGPDSSYLRMAVRSADPGAQVGAADEWSELNAALDAGADLLLLNRELGYGFDGATGIQLIKQLRAQHPGLRMVLVSNYSDAQAEAERAGALVGFGKREIGSARVTALLRDALAGTEKPIAEGRG